MNDGKAGPSAGSTEVRVADGPTEGSGWRSPAGALALAALAVAPGAAVLATAPDSPFLLAAVVVGVLVATLGLRLQGRRWRDVGVRTPTNRTRLAATVVGAVGVLVVVTRMLRPRVRQLTGEAADLSAFQAVEGDPVALLAGLGVVWTIAAFGEELLYRGFLLNVLREALATAASGRVGWGVALVATSALSGLGHLYQGTTGVILTGILALGFGAVYLVAGRNLWAAILTHGLYDTIGFLLLYLGVGAPG